MFGFFKKDKAVEVEVPTQVPAHIGIIMDGNGRWAKKRMQPRVFGHKAGMEALQTVTKAANKLGVKVITVYAFFYRKLDPPRSGSQVYHELASRVL